MKDVQSLHDSRRIDIRKVGVKNISYPITLLDKSHKTQQTVASVNMYVNLPHRFKGTHMSRFVEILNQFHGRFNLETLQLILQEMKERLDAETAHLEITFPYFFIPRAAKNSIHPKRYACRMLGSLNAELDLLIEVTVPIELSPCIKGDAGTGRTGFWGKATVSVRLNHFLWLEDLVELIEQSLQQHIIDQDNVEKICTRIGHVLAGNQALSWYKAVVENVSCDYTTSAMVEGDCGLPAPGNSSL